MSRYSSDTLDEASEELHGHKDWAYLDTFSKSEQEKILNDKNAQVVVFFAEAREGYLDEIETEEE